MSNNTMTEEQATRVTSSPVVFICGPTGSGKLPIVSFGKALLI